MESVALGDGEEDAGKALRLSKGRALAPAPPRWLPLAGFPWLGPLSRPPARGPAVRGFALSGYAAAWVWWRRRSARLALRVLLRAARGATRTARGGVTT